MTGNHSDAQLHRTAALTWAAAGWVLLGIVQALAIAYLLIRVPAVRLRVPIGLVVTVSFAAAAWAIRAVAASGAIAGALVAFSFYLAGGREGFFLLLFVFVATVLSSRFRKDKKRALELADPRTVRGASQVLANLWVAAVALIAADLFISPFDVEPILAYAALAALMEAAADTVASEVGEACSSSARLITTFKSVPAGTDGALSLVGSVTGILAAALLMSFAFILGFGAKLLIHRVFPAALVGLFFDSFLGATLQRRGLLSNAAVNLMSTAVAAALVVAPSWWSLP